MKATPRILHLEKQRDKLRKEIASARRGHGRRKEMRKELVGLTTTQIDSELRAERKQEIAS